MHIYICAFSVGVLLGGIFGCAPRPLEKDAVKVGQSCLDQSCQQGPCALNPKPSTKESYTPGFPGILRR